MTKLNTHLQNAMVNRSFDQFLAVKNDMLRLKTIVQKGALKTHKSEAYWLQVSTRIDHPHSLNTFILNLNFEEVNFSDKSKRGKYGKNKIKRKT